LELNLCRLAPSPPKRKENPFHAKDAKKKAKDAKEKKKRGVDGSSETRPHLFAPFPFFFASSRERDEVNQRAPNASR